MFQVNTHTHSIFLPVKREIYSIPCKCSILLQFWAGSKCAMCVKHTLGSNDEHSTTITAIPHFFSVSLFIACFFALHTQCEFCATDKQVKRENVVHTFVYNIKNSCEYFCRSLLFHFSSLSLRSNKLFSIFSLKFIFSTTFHFAIFKYFILHNCRRN